MPEAQPTEVLLTGYFHRNRDPQRRRRYRADDPALLSNWLPGVQRLGLHARIFHDGLSPAFVRRYESPHVRVEFALVPKGVSCNDQRFVVYHRWLRRHEEVRSAFCTDLFDVQVVGDPHRLRAGTGSLWVGSEPWRIEQRPTMISRLQRAYGRVDPVLRGRSVLNAGIVGGDRLTMLALLEELCEEIAAIRRASTSPFNCNMAALNTVLYRRAWNGRVLAPGRPLHSVFGDYEEATDVCFIHR